MDNERFLTVGQLREILKDKNIPDDIPVITCECELGSDLNPENDISFIHITTVGVISNEYIVPKDALLVAGSPYGIDTSYLAQKTGNEAGKVYF